MISLEDLIVADVDSNSVYHSHCPLRTIKVVGEALGIDPKRAGKDLDEREQTKEILGLCDQRFVVANRLLFLSHKNIDKLPIIVKKQGGSGSMQ